MAKKKEGSGVDWDSLTPEQQESYIPRGDYKNPEMLDQGNAPAGAPTTPQPELEDGDEPGSVKSKATAKKTDK